jgi:hypothetical protein
MFRLNRIAAILFILLLAIAAQAETQRLVLKDGSYQKVTKYEIKGDRVRYYSAERSAWEEIPKELIDWPATEKYAKDAAAGKSSPSPNARAVDAEEAAERAKLEAETPQVAPGIKLPGYGGVFLLDVFNKQPQLAELVQSGGEVNKQMGKNILRATINPIASNKQTIEIKGAHSRVQSHVGDPFIYILVDQDQDPSNNMPAENAKDHYKIVKVEEKKDARVVGNITTAIYGKRKQDARFIDTQSEVVQGGPWVKITPAEKLQPGEYAVVEMLGPEKKDMNLYVWDFGVNPAAPANPTAWKPAPVKPNLRGTDDTPVLKTEQKPK